MTDHEDQYLPLADDWIAFQSGGIVDSSAVTALIHMSVGEPEACWRVVKVINSRTELEVVRRALAVGPLEDLLVYHPVDFFPRVKALALVDNAFRVLLRNVWLDGNVSPIWREFYELAETAPPFPPGWK